MSDEDDFRHFVASKLNDLEGRIGDLQRTLDSVKLTVEVTQNELKKR